MIAFPKYGISFDQKRFLDSLRDHTYIVCGDLLTFVRNEDGTTRLIGKKFDHPNLDLKCDRILVASAKNQNLCYYRKVPSEDNVQHYLPDDGDFPNLTTKLEIFL
jgi:hypothetical protein